MRRRCRKLQNNYFRAYWRLRLCDIMSWKLCSIHPGIYRNVISSLLCEPCIMNIHHPIAVMWQYRAPEYLPVAYEGLSKTPGHRDAVLNAMVYVHQTLHQANVRVAKRGGRTIAITPRHYLDFINHYVSTPNPRLYSSSVFLRRILSAVMRRRTFSWLFNNGNLSCVWCVHLYVRSNSMCVRACVFSGTRQQYE